MSDTYTIILDPESGLQYKVNEDVVLKQEKQQAAKELESEIELFDDCNKEESSDEETNTKPIYIWKYDQVVELLNSISSHYEDLNNPRKRKQVFELVVNDLMVKDIHVTSAMVQSKWHGLVKSYRKAKENLTKTGRGPTRFNFFEIMEEMFGSNPPKLRSKPKNWGKTEPIEHVDIIVSMEESSTNDNNEDTKKSPPRKYQQRLRQQFMEWKSEELKRKQKRHKDKMKLEEAKLELEKRKVAILEKYLKLK